MGWIRRVRDRIAARYLLCLMFFLGITVTFILRVNINLAIVGMVNSTSLDLTSEGTQSNSSGTCLPADGSVSTNKQVEGGTHGEFNWSEVEQSVILSSFFWGYLVFQVPGGRVAEVVGAKRVFGGAVLINGVLSLVLPFLARTHWTLLLVTRALQGLAQGVVFPALSAAVISWVPLSERARFMSFAVQGASLGTVVAMPLCGLVLNAWGWEAVFYVSGALALLWCVAWWLLVFDTPDQHPRISREEKQYLKENITQKHNEKNLPVPWRFVLTSQQFILGCIAAVGNDWGFHTFMTLGPKYLKGALGFDVEKSSWFTSLPYLGQWVFASVYGTFADTLLKRKKMSLLGVRRLSIAVSHLLPAVSLLALSLAGCNATIAVVVLTIAVSLIGAYSSGFFQSPMDIAPNFAGSLTGLMNAIGSISPIVSTPIAGAVLQNDSTTNGWRVIFWIAALMYTLCSLPYIICFKAQIQPWNNAEKAEVKSAPALIMSNVASSDAEDGEIDMMTKSKQG
ncbi:putative inorganic phosphate cotransporter isoform X1 [Cryptotermes secundus]|uniref:putative inorganic phosphate cotransporter isoform X1 n=1 Tax=Cryptotermes secundus TaxID=105785 RepID=UPI001454BED8|nr:putative inorganic phosphate cotransporter isoform X1 [Cryptotermes secundus]XP_023709474.2 putative inorganic phosphate cotransporter isoform X1 [Cryptotermes secundus]